MSDQPDNSKILFQKKFPGSSFTIYPNRIEVRKIGGLMGSNIEMIPIKQIASIKTQGITRTLVVVDIGGKSHVLTGIANQDSKTAEQILLNLL
jgi:hypothetical protein